MSASPRGPRIGRPDRLAAFRAEMDAEEQLGLPPGMPATTQFLTGHRPGFPPPPPAATRETVRASAARLAQRLKPLPTALDELAKRITRHCANTGRDAELARAVELVRADTFELWCAIGRLAEAAQATVHRGPKIGRGLGPRLADRWRDEAPQASPPPPFGRGRRRTTSTPIATEAGRADRIAELCDALEAGIAMGEPAPGLPPEDQKNT